MSVSDQDFAGLRERVKILEQQFSSTEAVNNFTRSKELSPKEFLLRYGKITATDKVLVFGSFLEQLRNANSFDKDEIARLFLEAKEPQPANISDLIGKNMRKGYIMKYPNDSSETLNHYTLTATGENYVESLTKKSDE